MDKHLILTIISDDKPGVVKQIAKIVSQHKGNWLESQLAQLAGKFAGVIRISLPDEFVSPLDLALTNLSHDNIHVQVNELNTHPRQALKRKANFSAAGPDRQGIVLEITQAFTLHNINVEQLNTKCSSMPYSGEPFFEAEGLLSLPDDTLLADLIEQLDSIADQLGIDLSLEEASL